MRQIKRTAAFRRDYRRVKRGVHGQHVDETMKEILERLGEDLPLPDRNSDHALSGDLSDCRDCHLRPDLVLIYRKPDKHTLELVRIGSHTRLEL